MDGTAPVDLSSFLEASIPTTLWHYTSYAGATGILSSRAIWATEYRFLNDSEEVVHCKEIADQVADEQFDPDGPGFPAKSFLQGLFSQAFETGTLSQGKTRIMIASFSEVADQLSQWRGYADDACGVSLGLALDHLRPPKESGSLAVFAPCIYDDSTKKGLIRSISDRIIDNLRGSWDSAYAQLRSDVSLGMTRDALSNRVLQLFTPANPEMRTLAANFVFDLLRVAPLMKNRAFSEERESRLILPWLSDSPPKINPVKFRCLRNLVVPYIAHPLCAPDEPSPCHSVMLGPGGHPAAALGVEMFLTSIGLKGQIVRSAAPYRPKEPR